MKYILYYSNYCDHCKKLLLVLAKHKIEENEISYICIDKRKKTEEGIFAELNNGKLIPIPKNVTEVPSMLFINHGNSIITGDKILHYFKKSKGDILQDDPEAYSLTEMTGQSDQYSYLDMSSDDLSAKGDGGTRIMHGFVPLDYVDKIETPPEDDDTNNSLDMDKLMKKRNEEIHLNR